MKKINTYPDISPNPENQPKSHQNRPTFVSDQTD